VILPTGNERDLRDVPEDVREGMTFHTVERMEEVFDVALQEKGAVRQRRRARSGRGLERGRRAATEPGREEAGGDPEE
jgi:predicted ATP-dependent protease